MPFGKYVGWRLVEIPDGYLDWLTTIDLRPVLREAVHEEIVRRIDHSAAPARSGLVPAELRGPAADIVKRGYRACALTAHPDQGGTDEEMRRLVEARRWLEDQL